MSEALSCPSNETPAPGCRLGALYWACVRNDPAQLQARLDDGVSPEEATQVDGNGRVSNPGCFPGRLGQLCVPTTPSWSDSLREFRTQHPLPGSSGGREGVGHLWDLCGFRGHRG